MYSVTEEAIAQIAYRFGSIGWTVGISCWYIFYYELYNFITKRPRRVIVHFIVWFIGIIFWFAALDGSIYAHQLKLTAWWGWEEIVLKNSFWVIAYNIFISFILISTLFRLVRMVVAIQFRKFRHLIIQIGVYIALLTIPTISINLLVPILDLKGIPPFGHLLMAFVTLMIGRVVVKYRLLDINPMIAASQILFEISDYVFLTDLNGDIRKISNAAVTILNYDNSSISNKNITDITRGIQVEELNARSDKSGGTFKADLISDNNVPVPVRCKVTLINDTHGDPVGYLLVMTDLRDMIAIDDLEKAVEIRTSEIQEKNRKLSEEIFERKKIQNILINIEEKQRAMISNISDVIAIVAKGGKIIYNSPNLETIFGWKPEEVTDRSAYEFVHPDDLEYVKNTFLDLLEHVEATKTLEFRYLCGDGNIKMVHMTATNKVDNPFINGLLLNYYDVSDSAAVEKERQLRAARIQRQQEALLKITNDESIRQGNKQTSLMRITEIAAEVLDVERLSIWFFNKNNEVIECEDLYTKSEQTHQSGRAFQIAEYSDYLNNLHSGLIIEIPDIMNDERTANFRGVYLTPLGVSSLLDVGIRMSGKLIGVVSIAHVGKPRVWAADETAFATQLADQITQALLYGERKLMEDKLKLFANTIKSVSEMISITDLEDGGNFC